MDRSSLFRSPIAARSYSIFQPKRFPCLLEGQCGLALFKAIDRHLNVFEILKTLLYQLACKITFRQSAVFCHFDESALKVWA